LAARGPLREMAWWQSRGSPSIKARLIMILTHCPVCVAELPPLSAKQCSRCKTRYCGPECQKQHWEGGGHDKLCRKIRKGGGAEQYNANEKYAETVAVAAEACADDTKGQTCYICTQALHWKTKEGLVRGCSCRGTAGFVHVSCLAEQAKILYAEAEENNLSVKVQNERYSRWHTCSLCEQQYHGVVRCALGWACWKTYVGRPEADFARKMAMSLLGSGLLYANHQEDALSVQEAELSMMRRVGDSESNILIANSNLASTYACLGRYEHASRMQREVYSGRVRLDGEEHKNTLIAANNYAASLIGLERYQEVKSLMRKMLPVARRVLGESHDVTLRMQWIYARPLYSDTNATLGELRAAVKTLEEAEGIARRVLGASNPLAGELETALQDSRTALARKSSS
jgi:tetratricopeptide (TPR) repeat protein